MKRLVAQQKSSRHQHHEPMADELSSCPTTPIYDKVAHETTTSHHAHNKAATDQPIASKKEPLVSKTPPTSQPTATRQQTTPTDNRQQPTDKQLEENIWWMSAWRWLRRLLDFREDKAGDVATIESLKADVEFRGTKLWILICAILVASI
ncbi:MAG: TIGR00341 family protein, partial [Bacteroidales bacterium]|nr:TIGR00341 family protein [Bacteroidales bacterium]